MIMIHACPPREWYVNDFLIPSLTSQGIPKDEIIVWSDRDGKGNLSSCIETFYQCSLRDGETWHLQDDVIVCRDFANRTASAPEGVVCGFCVNKYEDEIVTGRTIPKYMWQSSFPCIKIPNYIAGEFVDWFIKNQHREGLQKYIVTGKKDDTLFRIFMLEEHFGMDVYNMAPHLVDHIDWMIGGSTINQTRPFRARAHFWDDEDLITELQQKLAGR